MVLLLYIYFAFLVCLPVCLHPINVKTAEPIEPKVEIEDGRTIIKLQIKM